MKKIVKYLLLSLFLFNLNTYGQNETDFHSWSALQLNYELNKSWKLALEEQLRLKEDLSTVDAFFTELTAQFEPNKKFEFGAGFRFIRANDNKGAIQGYESHIRYHFDMAYKSRIKQLALKQRLRYQRKKEVGSNKPNDVKVNPHIRYKSTITYKIKNWKLDPRFGAELFYQLGEERTREWDKLRLSIGSSWNIKKLGDLNFAYLFEKQLNAITPFKYHILSLKYGMDLNKSK